MAWTSSQAWAAFRLPLKAIICGWAEFLMGFFLSALTVQVPASVNMHFKNTGTLGRALVLSWLPITLVKWSNLPTGQISRYWIRNENKLRRLNSSVTLKG